MQYEVAAIHNLGQGAWGLHRRAQGLSLPRQLQVLHGDVHCVGLSVTASTHTHTQDVHCVAVSVTASTHLINSFG